MRIRRLLLLLAALLSASSAAAEVLDATPEGFSVRETSVVAAPPDSVWAVLIRPAAWWASVHTFSGDARNLSLDPRAGGAWEERLPGGGGVRHMVVVTVRPPAELRLEGALGPLQGLGASGHMTVTLVPRAGATEVVLLYDVGGHARGGLASLAPPVDQVLGEQLARLKAAVERGG